MNWEMGMDIYLYTTIYINKITNENLVYSTGNSIQFSMVTYWEGKQEKEWIYV